MMGWGDRIAERSEATYEELWKDAMRALIESKREVRRQEQELKTVYRMMDKLKKEVERLHEQLNQEKKVI